MPILTGSIGIQLPHEAGSVGTIGERAQSGLGKPPKALDQLEDFCSIIKRPTSGHSIEALPTTPLDGSYVSLIPTMKAWIQGCFASEDKLSQSLDPYFLQCGTESRALSSEDLA